MRKITTLCVFLLAAGSTGEVSAGLYSDELARCLVNSTTADDRNSLVRWMFIAASAHPAVTDIASVSEEKRDESDKKTAMLFMRLLTESCATQARDAVRYEGQIAIQNSFEVLGTIAGRELYADPAVTANMSGMDAYLDDQKLKEALGVEP